VYVAPTRGVWIVGYLGVQFEMRLKAWFIQQGCTEMELPPRVARRFDFVGTAPNGQTVVAEAKVTRRRVLRSTLVGWVAQLVDRAHSEFPDARMVLAISGPGLVDSAHSYATTAPVEVFLEQRPGEIELVTT